jgi:endogenous inhibitor of DNA gyrase (YacG/DUF329 family)
VEKRDKSLAVRREMIYLRTWHHDRVQGYSPLVLNTRAAARQRRGFRMAPPIPDPECLGSIARSYGSFCSTKCQMTALCVLIAMGEYLRQEPKVPPAQDSADSR